MANYNQLKAAIMAVIKENHNNEITGTDLQNVLVSMINSLVGYQFVGIATPTTNPGTPDARVFYIATEPGVYSNFAGINVSNQVAILRYGNAWEKLDTGIITSNIGPIMDNNSGLIETKVNAIISCLADLITKIVFHSGVPYQLPIELQRMLQLERAERSNTTAICGVAICGVAICGTN